MANETILDIVQNYMNVLHKEGVPVAFTVLYGSYARGEANEWSDIDLMVVSPLFDLDKCRKDINHLWHATLQADIRIEPVGIGVKQWEEDDGLPLIEMARREGEIIRFDAAKTH